MPSILASQLTNSKITMAMKETLFVSLMVATLAIPISGVQAFFFFFCESGVQALGYDILIYGTVYCPSSRSIGANGINKRPVFPSKFVQVNYFTYMVLFFIFWFYFLYYEST